MIVTTAIDMCRLMRRSKYFSVLSIKKLKNITNPNFDISLPSWTLPGQLLILLPVCNLCFMPSYGTLLITPSSATISSLVTSTSDLEVLSNNFHFKSLIAVNVHFLICCRTGNVHNSKKEKKILVSYSGQFQKTKHLTPH